MVQLLSLQLRGAVAYLARDAATRAYRVDAVHLGLALHAAKLLDASEQTGEALYVVRDGALDVRGHTTRRMIS